jgi:DNA-binding NarL/FixJ family response regulator
MLEDPGVIRIVVIDDHRMVADALAQTLDAVAVMEVAGTAPTLAEGLRLVEHVRPDVVIMDVVLPDGDGAVDTAKVLQRCPAAKVLVLSAQTGIDVVARAMEAGAVAFISKSTPLADLAEAVRRVQAGEVLFGPEQVRAVSRYLREAVGGVGQDLSDRELEVLELLGEGATTQEMVDRLHLSPHTVRNHIRNLSAKLGARSRLEAVAIANRSGLLRH